MKKATKNLLKAGTKPVNHTTQHKHEKPVCPADYPGHQFRSLTMMSDSSISSTILTRTQCSEKTAINFVYLYRKNVHKYKSCV
jgi:hypothetical protein